MNSMDLNTKADSEPAKSGSWLSFKMNHVVKYHLEKGNTVIIIKDQNASARNGKFRKSKVLLLNFYKYTYYQYIAFWHLTDKINLKFVLKSVSHFTETRRQFA
jgi:hypothetical protein